MNDIVTTQKNNWAVTRNNAEVLKGLIVNKKVEDLTAFVKNQVLLACVYRGINKNEEERSVIAMMFLSELQRRFNYLTTTQIANYLRANKYGAEFSNTVSPLALVECLEKSNFVFEQRNNHALLKAFKEHQNKNVEIEVLTPQEEIAFLKRGFDYWKRAKRVNDLDGRLWQIARKIKTYQPTVQDRHRYLSWAKAEAYQWFYTKDKYRFLTPAAVKNDKKFCQSKKFRNKLCSEYQEYWLRDFFRRCKWNKTKTLHKN